MERTFKDERDAKESRRDYLNDTGAEVSLIAYDPAREVYVFDVYAAAPGDAYDDDEYEYDDDEDECEGHESLNGADMGRTVYCDGSCK